MEKASSHQPRSWLSEVKQELMETEEWRAVSRHLLTNVEGRLVASGLAKFGEFDDQAKLHTLRGATSALQETSDFKGLSERVSCVVDRTLSERTTQRAMACRGQAASAGAAAEANPVDDVMLECCTCAEGILRRWPDLASTAACTRALANRPVPAPLRRAYWRSRWRCADAVERDFAHRCRTSPSTTVSPHDSDIGRRVQSLLEASEETRTGLAAWSKTSARGVLAVKRLLSAYHACSPHRHSMQMTEAMIHRSIPFVHAMLLGRNRAVTGVESSSVERLSDDVVAPMLGAFAGFEESLLPVCQPLTGETAKASANLLSRDVDMLLEEHDPRLRQHLITLLVPPTTPTTHETYDVCSPTSPTTRSENSGIPFYKYIRNMLHPYWQVLFSGVLPLEVVCFLWEQLWVFETSVMSPHTYLAVATTTWLLLLSDWLVESFQVLSMAKCLEERSRTLRVDDFRTLIDQLFLVKLHSSLGDGAEGAPRSELLNASTVPMPVPGEAAPWLYWTKDERKRRLAEERAAALEYRMGMLSRARHEAEDARRRKEEETKRVMQADGDAVLLPRQPTSTAVEPPSARQRVTDGEDLRRENARLRELLKQYAPSGTPGSTPTLTPTPPPPPAPGSTTVAHAFVFPGGRSADGSRGSASRSSSATSLGAPPPAPGPTTVTTAFAFPGALPPDSARGSAPRSSLATPLEADDDDDDEAQHLVRNLLQNVGQEMTKFVLGSANAADQAGHDESVSALRDAYNRDLLTVEFDVFGSNLTSEQWRTLSPSQALDRRRRVKKEILKRRLYGDVRASENQ